MAEGDGRNSPDPRVPRKQGRQPKDLAASAGGARREFAELIRTEFFDRLTALGVTTADISEALGSGFSATTLSRFRNADRVPDRDKLLRLLAYAEEIVGQPLPGEARERVIEAYYAALKISNKPLHDSYRLMDERDRSVAQREQALAEQRRLRTELVRCQESLEKARQEVASLETRARHTRRGELLELEQAQAAEDDLERFLERQEELARTARKARGRQSAARKEVQRLLDLIEQQDQQAARLDADREKEVGELRAALLAAQEAVQESRRAEQTAQAELAGVRESLTRAESDAAQRATERDAVLASRAEVSQLLLQARIEQLRLEEELRQAQESEAEQQRLRIAAERQVADLEERLVAAFRSRDALLEDGSAPKEALAEAKSTVDEAWATIGHEVARIQQQAGLLPPGETTTPTTRPEPDPEAAVVPPKETDTAAQTPASARPASPAAPYSSPPSASGFTSAAPRWSVPPPAGYSPPPTSSYASPPPPAGTSFNPPSSYPPPASSAYGSPAPPGSAPYGSPPAGTSPQPSPRYSAPPSSPYASPYSAASPSPRPRTPSASSPSPSAQKRGAKPSRSTAIPKPQALSASSPASVKAKDEEGAGCALAFLSVSLVVMVTLVTLLVIFDEDDPASTGKAGEKPGVTYLQADAKPDWTLKTAQPLDWAPVLDGGTLVTSGYNRDIYGADAKTGTLKWTTPSGGLIAQPVAANGLVHVMTMDKHLRTLEVKSGAVKWDEAMDGMESAAVTQSGVLVTTNGRTVTARLAQNGDELWTQSLESNATGRIALSQGPTLGRNASGGITARNGTAYVMTEKGFLWALDLSSGETKWKRNLGPSHRDLGCLSSGQAVVAVTDTHVVALDSAGKETWRRAVTAQGRNMAADDTTLYLRASTDDEKLLRALDLKTGKERWQRAFPTSSGDAPLGNLALFADRLYYSSQGRRLFALRTSDGGFLGPFHESDNKIRGILATAEGVYAAGVNHRLVHVPAGEFN
ncbi:PQQ-binding-like beta-propeller repeat protein [Streptomyces sp. NPDC007883]|uniref:outer membrane protein assembly factor BamB family protein n=1 Tax=Streptomyces sp. NPDC007883 TaxID=3155116 RepID=UPI0033FECD9E